MEYTVKIDKVDTPNMSYDSSAECLEIALEEYRHVTERANKYDNKIYIMITFCSVFFAFILTLLDKLVTLSFPADNKIWHYICIMYCALYNNKLVLYFFYAYTCYWITTNQITPF